MEIEYLQKLKENPRRYSKREEFRFEIKGISIDEIQSLEKLYNNGNHFPKSLRELLFLSGNYSYTFSWGINDSQKEMQERVRENLKQRGKMIFKPYYIIEVYDDRFFFVYLDEEDDPQIYDGNPWSSSEDWISSVDKTIKEFVEFDIDRMIEYGGVN
ncbi:SMI1/KNR4 family protein [Flavobacterium ajazii]|uniref:SMI1/KNR4 family protein n=1 Tax=Flavobacterium ajazii TaxID=2692318 RepID=UPI0013CFB67C|nr:SMI1/KNR4 family protein [Flavobacterium ajazii]